MLAFRSLTIREKFKVAPSLNPTVSSIFFASTSFFKDEPVFTNPVSFSRQHNKPLKSLAGFCLALVLTTSIGRAQEPTASGDLDLSTFDKSVRIQDDLYQFVNGRWLQETEIPADKSDFGAFGKLADLSQVRIKRLLEETAKGEHEPGSDSQKVGDFYRSFLDEEAAETIGIDPLIDELKTIDDLDSKAAVWQHFGTISQIGVSNPVGVFVSQDAKQSDQYLTQLIQSGISLPDRDYYFNDEATGQQARQALKKYIGQLFELANIEAHHEGTANDVFELEKRLAEISWERVELRNAEKRYNKHTLDQLQQLTPSLDWESLLAATGIDSIKTVNVNTPSFFESLESIINETPLETWQAYLKYQLLDTYAPYLSKSFVNAHFELYQKQLGGVPEQQPRWKRAVNATAGAGAGDFGVLGEVVGRLYVAKHFKPEAKARMDELVANLLVAFEQSIDELAWMTDETKAKAQEKLSKIVPKIGYPRQWRDYSQLEIRPDDLVGNIMRSQSVEHFRNINRLGKPVDREEWGMTPQTVNAYYNPSKNEIVFPAAILQAPFFSIDAPDALNYGGIGAVIGHEISHGFDDQGRRYDGDGNMVNWWSEADEVAFNELSKQLIAQFADYEPLPGKTLNGELTLGENIADLSGLTVAHRALKIAIGSETPEPVAGWNADQLFFVGWSRVWQRKYRDAEMIKRLLTDPHSPSQYRTNGPVTNIDAFHEAFDVQPGDALYKPPVERIRIW